MTANFVSGHYLRARSAFVIEISGHVFGNMVSIARRPPRNGPRNGHWQGESSGDGKREAGREEARRGVAGWAGARRGGA